MLGMGAGLFDAERLRKPITFTWDRVIALDGDTGPYVQYAHARILSVLRKAGADWADRAVPATAPDPESPLRRLPGRALPGGVHGRPGGRRGPGPALRAGRLAGRPARQQREAMATPLARQLLAVAKTFGLHTHRPVLWPENSPAVREARWPCVQGHGPRPPPGPLPHGHPGPRRDVASAPFQTAHIQTAFPIPGRLVPWGRWR